MDRLVAHFKEYLSPGTVPSNEREYEDEDDGVHVEVDDKELTYSVVKTGLGDGPRTVDVILDRVVFGGTRDELRPLAQYAPARDIKATQRALRHRRHRGRQRSECRGGGPDTGGVAKKHYPDSPLAQVSDWKAPVQHGGIKSRSRGAAPAD